MDGGYILGTVSAVLALAATIVTIRSARRVNAAQARKGEAEAAGVEDANAATLRAQLATEFNQRMSLELKVASLERRVQRLEQQVRDLGHTPVNGD